MHCAVPLTHFTYDRSCAPEWHPFPLHIKDQPAVSFGIQAFIRSSRQLTASSCGTDFVDRLLATRIACPHPRDTCRTQFRHRSPRYDHSTCSKLRTYRTRNPLLPRRVTRYNLWIWISSTMRASGYPTLTTPRDQPRSYLQLLHLTTPSTQLPNKHGQSWSVGGSGTTRVRSCDFSDLMTRLTCPQGFQETQSSPSASQPLSTPRASLRPRHRCLCRSNHHCALRAP